MQLSADAERGRQLFAKYGCNTCHAIDDHGPRVGPDLARLPQVRSQDFLRKYVLQPPPNVAMPGYRARISDEELEQVVAFVLVVQTARRR
jgi:putative heme-binding domain-containing protein